MGREINETVEDVEEEDEDEDEECVGRLHVRPRRGLKRAHPAAGLTSRPTRTPTPGRIRALTGCWVRAARGHAAQPKPQPCSRRVCAGELFAACASHDTATVLPLLPRAAAFLNTLGPEGDTLLHTASLYGFTNLVEALLAAGADPAVKDENSSTPLVRRALSRQAVAR